MNPPIAARGRELARGLIAEIVRTAREVQRTLGRPASLAIVAGDDADSRKFVDLKRDALADVAIDIRPVWLAASAVTEAARGAIQQLNERNDVDAIFLQFPLPGGVDAQAASNIVAIAKDIDCSGSAAERAFLTGRSPFTPVAPQAAFDLLQHELRDLRGKRVVVPGGDDPFVRALAELLTRADAYVVRFDAKEIRGQWDAVVIGDILPSGQVFNRFERIAVLLDAGYYLPARRAGWLPESARSRIGIHLTQYGNTGPLTVAHLARATLLAASRAKA